MQDHPVLGHVALGYSPIIDRQRNVVATRLTVFADGPTARPTRRRCCSRCCGEVWPRRRPALPTWRSPLRPLDPALRASRRDRAAAAAAAPPPVSLNVADEAC